MDASMDNSYWQGISIPPPWFQIPSIAGLENPVIEFFAYLFLSFGKCIYFRYDAYFRAKFSGSEKVTLTFGSRLLLDYAYFWDFTVKTNPVETGFTAG